MATMQEAGAKLREIEAELRSLDAAERDLTNLIATHPNILSGGTSGLRSAASELGSEINEAAGRLAKIRVDREKLLGEQARLKEQSGSDKNEALKRESITPSPTPKTPQPPPSPSPSQTWAPHPILDVEGKFSRITEVIDLTIDGNEFAFSDTVRGGLAVACGDKLRLSGDNEPIIGIGNFLRGCLAEAARNYRPERPPFTLAEAIVAFLTQQGDTPPTLEKLQELIAARTPPNLTASVADPGLTRVLCAAARLVREMTPGQTRVDMRHVLIAALKTPQAQRLFYRIDVTGPSPDLFFLDLFDEIKTHVLSHASGAQGNFDAREAATHDIDALQYLPDAAPQLLQRSAVHYAGDRELKTLAEDQLGVADEARALAEVVCLREPGPPLAVGLFGDWGSGKSSFMNLLRGAIDELTGKVDPDDTAGATMVRKVVHVKFNAWHYNDANLWASITTEFFVQLRAGGFDKRAGVQYAALVNALAERVAESEQAMADSTTAERLGKNRLGELDEQLDQLKKDQVRAPIKALAEATKGLMEEEAQAQPRRVVEAMALVGQPLEVEKGKEGDPAEVVKALKAKQGALKEEFERATGLLGHLRLIGNTAVRAARRGDLITILLLVAFAAVAAGGVWLLREASHQDFKTVMGGFGGIAALLVGIWGRAYKMLGPVIRSIGTFAKSRAEEETRIKKEIEEKNKARKQVESEIGIAKLAREKSEREATRFRGGSPDQLLDWLLNVSDETRRFEKELGTISQVRRLFEQLDSIFVERAKLEQMAQKPDLTVEERQRTEKKLSTAKGVTDGIDRIILYIDDLDRCNAKQVVKVLEAVHLLLAFPLFVVVVGVDARWLKHALLKVYQKELHDSDRSKLGQIDRASEQDYLEKIFQVPIHLKPLRGGTYFNAFLNSVAGPVARKDADGGAPPPVVPNPTVPSGGGQLAIKPVAVRADEETIEETVERVTLHEAELLQIKQLSVLLAKSPRAVKRFMNVYRLIRGLKRGPDLAAFLGGPGRVGTYPAVLFWLAARLGLAPDEARHFRTAVLQLKAEGKSAADLRLALTMAELPKGQSAFDKSIVALRRVASAKTIEDCCATLEAVIGALPGPDALKILSDAEEETLRFTLEGA